MNRGTCAALLLAALLPHPVQAAAFPADSGVIDVRSFGAKGDGRTDDTQAILAAIAASGADTGRSFWHDRIVYLPDGTYRISATLLKRYANGGFASGLSLIGQSRERTVLRLADHAPGFDDPARPRAIVFTSSKHLDGSPTGGGKDYPGLGEGNDAYMNFIEDLTIEAGAGNPGAIGIDYLANNIGAIRNVHLRAAPDSGAIGLSMRRKWPGPALVQRLHVEGFGTGIATAQTEYGLTLEHISLSGQRSIGLQNDRNALSIRGLEISGGPTALVNAGPGALLAIDGGRLHGTVQNAGTLVARGVAGLPILKRPDWAAEPVDTPPLPQPPLAQWANAAAFGAVPDGQTDATDALRRAFASGAAVVFLPGGTYAISGRIDLPPSLQRLAGMNATLHILTPRQPGFARSGGMLRIATGGGPVTIERLAFDNTGGGEQVAVEAAGPRDVVLRDVISAGVTVVDRAAGGGRLFIENTCCGRLRLAGPAPVFARQLDTEGGGVRIANNGAPLWVLGLKTEGVCTAIANQDGARTEVFGGLLYMVRPSDPAIPAFRNQGGWLAATFVEEALLPGRSYRLFLQGPGQDVPADSFPPRGLGRAVPLLHAGPDGVRPQ